MNEQPATPVIRYRMELAYDGTAYAGWQIQPDRMTVQERVQGAISQLSGEQVKVHGSGRTDQGVHARRQVAHFDLTVPVVARTLLRGLNALLPPDIRVLAVRRAPAEFHARRSASGKEYRYFIWNADIVPPVLRYYRAQVRKKLSLSAMQEAAAVLVGKHDFAAFTGNPAREVGTTVRELFELKVVKRGAEIVIIARADGFLYKMVRSLAGFLIRVGEGSATAADARRTLRSRVRTARVPTGQPQGLFLWKVSY